MGGSTPSQITADIYAVNTAGGRTLLSNDRIATIAFPDPSAGKAGTVGTRASPETTRIGRGSCK